MDNQLYLEALKLFNNKKFNKSKKYFEKLLNNNFQNNDLLKYLSLNYIYLGQFHDAIKILQETIIKNKEDINSYLNLAYCYQCINDTNKSIEIYKTAIEIEPNNEQPYLNLGTLFRKLKQYQKSEKILLSAINLKSHKVYTTLSSLYIDTKEYEKAIYFANKANELNPSDILAINNLGIIYINMKQYDKALRFLEKGLKINSDDSLLHLNLGVLNKNLMKLEKAKVHFQKSIRTKPDLYDAYLYLSLVQLSENNFAKGWDNYEYRWYKQVARIKPNCIRWDGNKNYSHILIWGEQGLGEQILFASIIPEILNIFKKLTLVVDQKLKPIFQDSFQNINIYSPNEDWQNENFDCHLPMASLGKYFRNNIKDFPLTNGFLKSSPKINKTDKIKCGLSWKSVNSVEGDSKSLNLDHLLPLIKNKNLEFYNVQYTNENNLVDKFNKDHNVNINNLYDLDAFNDLYGLSKYLKSFDILLSISNTTAHLAAALGVPTMLLLPKSIGKLWYWSNSIEDRSLWYSNVKIFRQTIQDNWDEPIINIINYIDKNGFKT